LRKNPNKLTNSLIIDRHNQSFDKRSPGSDLTDQDSPSDESKLSKSLRDRIKRQHED